MRRDVLSGTNLTQRERALVRAVTSIRAFDEVFTAPRNGFRDAEDYYSLCSASPSLGVHVRAAGEQKSIALLAMALQISSTARMMSLMKSKRRSSIRSGPA